MTVETQEEVERVRNVISLSREETQELHKAECSLPLMLVRPNRLKFLIAQVLYVSHVGDGIIRYRCPFCDGKLERSRRIRVFCYNCMEPFMWRYGEEKICPRCKQTPEVLPARAILNEKKDSKFHAEGCALSKEGFAYGKTVLFEQDLIVLPVSLQSGHAFFEAECPSCHEWIGSELPFLHTDDDDFYDYGW